jgi:hypothetical protein
MDAHPNTSNQIQIDDRFLGDWVEYGIAELSAYLANHLRFARWCEEHRPPDCS